MSKGSGSVKMPSPDEYMNLVNAEANANRINQSTPFGKIKYKNVGKKPMSFDKWKRKNTSPSDEGYTNQRGEYVQGSGDLRNLQKEYKEYAAGVPVKRKAQFKYSKPIQNLFNQQFDPESYDNYADEYMGRYNTLMEPVREQQMDRFQQTMFDRGLPEGGEVYGDLFRTTVGDPNARQDLMATQQAQGLADSRRQQDWMRLAQAMGLSNLNSSPVNVLGGANMAMNANAQNAQINQQQNSDIMNAMALMGAAAVGCSHDFKENKHPVTTLEQLCSIPVEGWTYRTGYGDEGDHIGPYAEDFKEAFGVGDGKTIAFIDMMGVLMRSVQELAAEVREIKCKM